MRVFAPKPLRKSGKPVLLARTGGTHPRLALRIYTVGRVSSVRRAASMSAASRMHRPGRHRSPELGLQ
jgi:hypothetical protein